ncbi:MAG: DUF2490 domain-containing protein [Bacteroidales bacterium]|nr:DUF2490 domain-containing protein [Bacteroidales bacterium]
MKRILLIAALAMFPLSLAFADSDPEQFGTRYSAKANWKVSQGIHVLASEEVRLGPSFNFDKTTTTIGGTYKINNFMKVGLAYSAIGVSKSSGLDWRHRASLSLGESYKWEQFHFSFRETFQATYRVKENLNTYQTPRTKLVFKARAKASYKPIHSRFTPYAQAELRFFLNGANWVSDDEINYSFDGHNDFYMNRVRFQAGTEYRFNLQHAIEFFVHYDYLIDKDIDYSRTLGKLQTITITQYPYLGLGVGYLFTF